MERGKPQEMEMTVEINSIIKYAIYLNMIVRQHKRPTSYGCSMKPTIEDLTQNNTPAPSPQQPSNVSIW
jgi:hypothetical protein